jgi:hypothetical protein
VAGFLAELQACDEDVVAAIRQLLERTKIGTEVLDLKPGRHDYVVAVPTKAENLQRIANVFAAMQDGARGCIVDIMRNNPQHWKCGIGDSQA